MCRWSRSSVKARDLSSTWFPFSLRTARKYTCMLGNVILTSQRIQSTNIFVRVYYGKPRSSYCVMWYFWCGCGETWNWSLLGVKGLMTTIWLNFSPSKCKPLKYQIFTNISQRRSCLEAVPLSVRTISVCSGRGLRQRTQRRRCPPHQLPSFPSCAPLPRPKSLVFRLLTALLSLPRGPDGFLGSTASSLLVDRLWKEPKPIATTVHARQITLYGILKSGVGRVTSTASVWRRTK